MADRGSIARALSVIRLLSRSPEPLRVKALADALGLPMSTAHRYLDLLAESGFIEKDRKRRYAIGVELHAVAKAVMETPSLFSAAPAVIDDVSSATGEFAVFNVYSRRHKFVSYVASSTKPSPWTLALDQQQPLARGASGLAMLAFLPGRVQEDIIRKSEAAPIAGVLDRDEMIRKLRDIRALGYAVTEQERIQGAAGIAVPIIRSNEVAGSMGLIIPMGRFERRNCEAYGQVLRDAARRAVASAGGAASLHA